MLFNIFSEVKSKLSWIIAGVVIIAVVLTIIIMYRSCTADKQPTYSSSYVNDLKQQIKIYKDDSGSTHARLDLIIYNTTTDKIVYAHTVDSLSKLLKIKPTEITQYIQAVTKDSSKGSFKLDTIHKTNSTVYDKGHIMPPTFIDSSINLKVNDGYLNFNGNLLTDQYTYTYIDSLNIIQFTEPTGFLGLKQKTYLDIYSNNKNTTIKNAKGFMVQDKYYNLLSLGIGAGVTYYNSKWQVFPVGTLTVPILTIKAKRK